MQRCDPCWRLPLCLLALAVAGGCGPGSLFDSNVVVVEHTRYDPPETADFDLTDDRLEEKQSTFDPALVDRRPLRGWLVNQSEAILRLDTPLVHPDSEADLLLLEPDYGGPLKENELPSVNLIGGKAKQFDDGLFAAIELAHLRGVTPGMPSYLDLLERLRARLKPGTPAADYLAAALTLGGRIQASANSAKTTQLLAEFRADPTQSKPLGFYTWNAELRRAWEVLRFLQTPLRADDPIVTESVTALNADPQLAAEWRKAVDLYAGLTNPFTHLAVIDLAAGVSATQAGIEVRNQKQVKANEIVSFLPPSTSRETELFERLFPGGLPQGTALMRELIRRLRSGETNLQPRPDSGWYDHQVYALETLLMPQRGAEGAKLLLTAPYKRRMLEAFAAQITKYRETHVRGAKTAEAASAMAPELDPLKEVSPRLRVEPCPSFYLRTARSYAFLDTFLRRILAPEVLSSLRGLRADGDRGVDLAPELKSQRKLFLGLYLVSCDDIGLQPELIGEEAEIAEESYTAAIAWLEKLTEYSDRDLDIDTRVAVPIYFDPMQRKMRLWATIGVRRTKLEVSYARPPRIKSPEAAEWTTVEKHLLKPTTYLISVDEFAEVEVPHLRPPNREEFRALCDRYRTKAEIVQALARGAW